MKYGISKICKNYTKNFELSLESDMECDENNSDPLSLSSDSLKLSKHQFCV